MLKQESNEIGSGENNRARACDTCRSTACTVYCHADSAYLCTSCDAQVHSANRVASRHKRVPVCESCERSPAAFMCEADDASLCTACDSEVHSANPLARRHQRVPVLPISGHSCSSSMAKEAASWLFPPNSDKNTSGDHNNVFLFSDEYLDLVDYKSTAQYNQHQQDCSVPHGGDGVVPLQLEESRRQVRHKQQNFRSGFTFDSSASHYSYNGGSIKHDAYNSAMETDFVPDSTASFPIQMLSPMDREARVLF